VPVEEMVLLVVEELVEQVVHLEVVVHLEAVVHRDHLEVVE
jgi:hypothetical protein